MGGLFPPHREKHRRARLSNRASTPQSLRGRQGATYSPELPSRRVRRSFPSSADSDSSLPQRQRATCAPGLRSVPTVQRRRGIHLGPDQFERGLGRQKSLYRRASTCRRRGHFSAASVREITTLIKGIVAIGPRQRSARNSHCVSNQLRYESMMCGLLATYPLTRATLFHDSPPSQVISD